MSVVIETTLGDITVDLFLNQRPVSCLNFLKLCKMKYYNFNLFHTIRSGFIAQTGDPSGEGSGGESIFGVLEGPSKRFFSGEKMPKIRHTYIGLLSMVCTDDMMVGSQFFFTLGPDLDSLDGVHCVIGEVTEGHEVLRKLNEVICDESHRPYQDVRITHTVVLEDPFNDPPGLRAPSRSPSPNPERLKGGRIAPDEDLDETQGKTAEEIQEIIEAKEAKARATILEIIGDLPDADIAPPENVLFVCKLNPVTTDEDLEIIFSRFGKIESCEVIRDKRTGDSLQYAFIEFADKKSCEDAYFKMDNVLIDDRRIHVDFSQSVSKIKWLGKGRGVRHINEDESKEKSRREKRPRSRDRQNKNHRDSNRHVRHNNERNRENNNNDKNRNRKDESYSKRNRPDRERSRSRTKYDESRDYSKSRNNTHEESERRKDKHRKRSKSRDITKEFNKELSRHHNAKKDDVMKSGSNSKQEYRESKKDRNRNENTDIARESKKDESPSRRQYISEEYIKERYSRNISGEYVRSHSSKLKTAERREKSRSPVYKSQNNHREYSKEHDHNGKNNNSVEENKTNEKEMEYKKKESRHFVENQKKIERTKNKNRGGEKESTPPVKRKDKKIKLKNSKKQKVVKESKGSKRKRKQSSSTSSSSSESDSSDSNTSSSDSSSSSDSDRKKKKLKARKRKHSETSSSSSTSSTTSSSSDSSTESSSSSSDSEPRKKKSKNKHNSKKDKMLKKK